MDYGAAETRGEEKSRLILGQLASIRSRLNALALQQGLFGGLTFILCAVILIVVAAFAFSPLTFLLLSVVVIAAALVGAARTAHRAWAMRASDERAALIADQRAALKGRLTTMVDATRVEQRSSLWAYLVEDTLALSQEFVAEKVEPHRVSRWLWAALASCAIAALVMRFAYGVRNSRMTAGNRIASVAGEPTADLGDLDIRPADPSADPGTEIDADPATMRKLAEKLREAQNNSGHHGSPTSRLMADARDAASALQNRLTGGKPAEATASRLKLTDRKGGDAEKSASRNQDHPPAKSSKENSQNPDSEQQSSHNQNQTQPPAGPPPGTPDMSGLAALNGLNSDDPKSMPHDTPPDSRKPGEGGPLGAGGSDHGSGSDPRHLYGEVDKPPLGNDTFRIPVEVSPSEDGSNSTTPASPPQRTKSTLNASQAPDEPFERASIPASDRVTIKRVFER